jgi:hypothetical protein
MTRRITFGILLLFAPLLLPAQSAQSPGLRKYLQPAGITKLDWLLLKVQVESFTTPTDWDDYDLIKSVSLYATPKGQAGMVFVVKKKSYIALPDELLKRVLADVVSVTCKVITVTIPEVKNCANVYASFVADGVIASGYDGKVTLTPRN